MGSYIITPGGDIGGTVKISGSKNSALPIMAASLLAESKVILKNIPRLSDIKNMCLILEAAGSECIWIDNNTLSITPNTVKSTAIDPTIAGSLRASFLIIGSLLAKKGKAKIPLPGGCAIGARPIDLHLKGFNAMGASARQGHGYIEVKCKKLIPNDIYLDFPSVGATENIMIAAAYTKGETVIENAATEPEIIDLSVFLTSLGAKIQGAGTETLRINGTPNLKGCEYTIIPDRIEAGTFMTIAASLKHPLRIENVVCSHLKPVTAKLCEMGFEITENINSTCLCETKISDIGYKLHSQNSNNLDSIDILPCEKIKSADIKTLPFPGFPTDMQAQFMSLLSICDGTGIVSETVFENRFMHVPELLRMGAKIKTDGRTAVIDGVKKLSGTKVKATDLRAGAALVIAALSATGNTEISGTEHIERGYENFEEKLRNIGIRIEKIID